MTETALAGAPEDALPEGPSDAELISAVRRGEVEAYGELYARHVDSANRLARSLSKDGEADDLVSEAFAKVLVVLQRGEGPDTALRPYLLTALRRLHIDRVRSLARTRPTEDMSAFDAGEAFQDTVVSGFESGAAARAFGSLPERWQLVLWHLEVEGQKPADVAPLLGISANSVSALAYRAREGLRQAFVTMHAQEADDARCATTRARLGAFIRNDVSKRDSAAVDEHLRECRECAAIYLELVEVNSDLRAFIAPLVLGGAAATYLSGVGTAGASGVAGLVAAITAFVADNAAKTVAGVAAAGVVVAGVVAGVTLSTGGDEPGGQGTDRPTAASAKDPAGPDGGRKAAGAGGRGGKPAEPGQTDPSAGADQATPDAPPTQPSQPSQPDHPGQPDQPRPTDEPTDEPTADPRPPVDAPPAIRASASSTGGLAWVVDLDVKGLDRGEHGALTVTLDRPAAAIDLDPRCDLIGLGRVTCRLTGPGRVRLVVTPLPGGVTTLTSVLQPGGDRSSIRLT